MSSSFQLKSYPSVNFSRRTFICVFCRTFDGERNAFMELFVQLLINGLFSSVNGTRRVRKTNMSKIKYVDLFIIGENVSHVEEFHIEVKEIKVKTVLKSELPQAKLRCLNNGVPWFDLWKDF